MDAENETMEDKCENLMNIVVESRKRFGKMCIDYDHKTSLVENKLLKLQIETLSNYRFKPKPITADLDTDDMRKDIDDFVQEMNKRQRRMHKLQDKLKNAKSIVNQLNNDSIGKKMHQPLTAEAMLSVAKAKTENKLDLQ